MPYQINVMFTDNLPYQDDPAGQEKIKTIVYYKIIYITKITMIVTHLEDTISVHS